MAYRGYSKDDTMIFGIKPEDRMKPDSLAHFISKLVDEMDTTELDSCYSDKGTKSYDPKMMLKIVIFAFLNGIYTSRKIEKAVEMNLEFIWLANQNAPDFRTISHFCWTRCRDFVKQALHQIVLKAVEAGNLNPDNCFVDGTTIRANANKHSHVWRKNVVRYQEGVKDRVNEVFEQIEIDQIIEDKLYKEDTMNTHASKSAIDAHNLNTQEIKKELEAKEELLKSCLAKLKAKPVVDKQVQKELMKEIRAIGKALKEDVPKLEKYDKQIETMGENRNSYSKTDPDASFLMHKDQQLLPGYMVSISTSDQMITGINMYNSSREGRELPNLLKKYFYAYGSFPKTVIADAAYGTGFNLDFVNQAGIEPFLKAQDYKIGYKESAYPDLTYYPEQDIYKCIEGKVFVLAAKIIEKENGPEREVRRYTCHDCKDCPKIAKCIRNKNKSFRTITVDPYLSPLRKTNYENITSEHGKKLLIRRSIEPEQVFGQCKWNMKFTRFTVRSLPKCEAQFTLFAIAHNIGKMYRRSENIAKSA